MQARDRRLWSDANAASMLRVLASVSTNVDVGTLQSVDEALALADAAVGIHQHHDAITGTDLIVASEDYIRRMAVAASALDGPAAKIAALVSGTSTASANRATGCPQSNISICAATDVLGTSNTGARTGAVNVAIFNPIATTRDAVVVSIPVPVDGLDVRDMATGKAVVSEVHTAFAAGAGDGDMGAAAPTSKAGDETPHPYVRPKRANCTFGWLLE